MWGLPWFHLLFNTISIQVHSPGNEKCILLTQNNKFYLVQTQHLLSLCMYIVCLTQIVYFQMNLSKFHLARKKFRSSFSTEILCLQTHTMVLLIDLIFNIVPECLVKEVFSDQVTVKCTAYKRAQWEVVCVSNLKMRFAASICYGALQFPREQTPIWHGIQNPLHSISHRHICL